MIGTEAKDYQFLQRRYGQEEDAIVCLTDAGVVCYANEPFCRRLGYDPETVFGRSAEEIIEFAPLEGLEPDQETESLGRSRITYVLDTAGRRILVSVENSPLVDRGAHFEGVLCRIKPFVESGIAPLVADPGIADADLRELVEKAVVGLFRCSSQGRFLLANAALVGIFGYASPVDLMAQVQDMGVDLWLDPEEYAQFLALLKRDGAVSGFEALTLSRSGGLVWISVHARAVRGMDGDMTAIEGMMEDITARKRGQWLLEEAEQRYRGIFEHASEGLFQCTVHGRFVSGNPALARILGYESFQEMEQRVADMGESLFEDPERYAEFILRLEDHGAVEDFETMAFCRGGDLVWISISAREVRNEEGQVVMYEGSIQDITDRKAAESRLLARSGRDELTGLLNRAMFMNHLKKAFRRARRVDGFSFALAVLDVDGFGAVNREHGREIGDQMLTQTARRLDSCLRIEDVLARMDNDEFAVLMSDVGDMTDALRVADRLLGSMAEPFQIGNAEVRVTASMGLVMAAETYAGPEKMLDDADSALYRARKGGARFEVFDLSQHTAAVQHLTLERDVLGALDRGEFRLFYQPMVELRTGRIKGFEAFIRWAHPDSGLLMPADFLPLLVKTGMMAATDSWVLMEAGCQLKAWQSAHPDLSDLVVSVNVTARELLWGGLEDRVRDALAVSRIDPACLMLEFPEPAVAEHGTATARDCLGRLKAMGVLLALDDFGVRRGSLASLSALPVDLVKIDRQIFSPGRPKDMEVETLRAMVFLVRDLGKEVLAEGVEDAVQLDELVKLACEYAQGYYFCKPVTAEEADSLLSRGEM